MSATAVKAERVVGLYRRHLSVGRARLAELTGGIVEVRSQGSRVWSADGVEYLDGGGYGVFILGHRHPLVVEAVIEQIRSNPLATRLLLEPTAAAAAEELSRVTPPGLDRVHFVNSGAECVEAAIKLARIQGCRTLISAEGGFHGKTMGALSLTAKELYQAPFRPLLPNIRRVPYGDVQALEAALQAAEERCCVFLEPVQGEAGVVLPPDSYLAAVAAACRDHDALLALDEVQTGLGRLGSWWGADRDGVVPDMLLVGKGLSGGVVPVAALVATDAIYAPFSRDPFIHTSTFGAAPIAMAAAAATVRVIACQDVVGRAARLGDELLNSVSATLLSSCPQQVSAVRGRGLLLGIECVNPQVAADLTLALLERRVLVNHSLNNYQVVRLTPPAFFSDEDITWLLEAVAAAGRTVAAMHVSMSRSWEESYAGRNA